MKRIAVLVRLVAGALVLLILTSSAAIGGTRRRPATWMTVRGLTDRATLTSICGHVEDGGSFCEVTGRRFAGRLPVRPGDFVRVLTRPPAGMVKAYLLRLRPNGQIAEWLDWSRHAREVHGSDGRRWRFRLPGTFGDANAIHLFMYYPGGAPYPGGDTVDQATYTSRIAHD